MHPSVLKNLPTPAIDAAINAGLRAWARKNGTPVRTVEGMDEDEKAMQREVHREMVTAFLRVWV